MSLTCGVRRIHLQIFQQGAFFTFIETGKANHAVERADPTVSVKVGDFRCAVALVTGAVVQRIRISPDRFDIVHHVAFLHPRSGLQLAPLGIGVGNGGFLQRFYLLLHITTNRGNKDAFTWELGEYTLTSGAFRPAGNFNLQPVAVTFKAQARLQSYFTQEGYTVSVTASGAGLREIMQNQSVDLILLDINLPDENGLMLTRALRERSTVGIILVTGRSDRIDRIVGLEMGADDYVTKPLELRELVVRVKNLLWRIDLARQAQPHTQDNCYRFAGYCLNVSRHTLERDGEPIKLTRAEYEMLVAFVTNPGEILSRERLLRMLSARRVENPDLRTVDVLIRRLRHKLSADLLVTQHGEGYFLAADVC